MVRDRLATTRKQSTRDGGSDTDKLRRLGRAIRLLRTSRELTQLDLSVRANVSKNHVWALESGKKEPGVLLLQRIAHALDTPLELFLVAVGDPKSRAASEEFVEGRQLMMSLLEGLGGGERDARKPKKAKAKGRT